MDIKNFQLATWAYVQNFIKPNLINDLDKWMLYFGMGVGTMKFEKMLNTYLPMAKQIGVINENNEIDIEMLQKYGKFAFSKQNKLKIWKLTFREKDFDDFITCLKNGNVKKQKIVEEQ